jgi:Mg2+ and Co2+ transporter CorA
MSLSPETLSTAPRTEMPVLLKEVFMLVASAECQFLNRVHGVTREQQKHLDNEKQMELALNTLLYIKALLDDHKQRLQQTIAFLKAHETPGSESLPSGQVLRAAATSQTVPRGELGSILADFEELLNRSKDLGDFCIESMDLIMNTAMLRESQKAVGRADDQKRLTILAYLFLPLSLVASIFGMNVKELGTGSQHIWLPVIILGPVTLFAWALSHPNFFEPWVVKPTKSRRSEIPTYQTQGAT